MVGSTLSTLLVKTQNSNWWETPDQRRTGKRWKRQAVEFGEKAAFLPVAVRREGREQVMRRE